MSESVAKIRISADDREVVAAAKRTGDAFSDAAGKAGKVGDQLQTTLGRVIKIAAGVQALSGALQQSNERTKALNSSAADLAKTMLDIDRSIAVAAQRTGLSAAKQAELKSVASSAADQNAAVKAIEEVGTGKVRGNVTDYVRAAGTGLFQQDELERARRFGITRDEVFNRIDAMPESVKRDAVLKEASRGRTASEVFANGDPAVMANANARAEEIRRARKSQALGAVGDIIESAPLIGGAVRGANDRSDLKSAVEMLTKEMKRVAENTGRKQINYEAR